VHKTAILFDLDGTLIDSAPSILGSFSAALAEQGISPVVDLHPGLIGPPLLQTLTIISGTQDPETLQRLAASFKAHYDTHGYKDSVVYGGVSESLRVLKDLGYAMYVVTNKRIVPTRKIIEYLGWEPLFEGVYAQDAFTPSLTSKAAVIEQVLQTHQINPERAVYVGDRSEDGEAARACDVPFCWVRWGYGQSLDADLWPDLMTLDHPELLVQVAR